MLIAGIFLTSVALTFAVALVDGATRPSRLPAFTWPSPSSEPGVTPARR